STASGGWARSTTVPGGPTPSTARRSPTAPGRSPSARPSSSAWPRGRSAAGRRWRSVAGLAELDEGHPQLVHGALQLAPVGLELVAEALDEGGHGVDGQGGLGPVGLLLAVGGRLPL